MKITNEEQVSEAIERMRLLNLSENVIKEFEREGKVNFSEGIGFLYWVDDDNYARFVREFESSYNAVVYHCIHNTTEAGEMLAMLYVSSNPDEWDYDRADIKDSFAIAYVKNITDDYCSEFGSIGFRPNIGGLIRTA